MEQNKLCGLSLSLSLSLSNNRQSSLLTPHPSALCFHPPARSMTRQLLQQYCDYRVTTPQSMSAPANSRLLETPGVFLALAGAEQAIRRVGIIFKEMFPSRDIAMFDKENFISSSQHDKWKVDSQSECGWNCCDSIFVIRFVTCHTSGLQRARESEREDRTGGQSQQM